MSRVLDLAVCRLAQRAAFGALGLGTVAILLVGVRLMGVRGEAKELREDTLARQNRLIENRRALADAPREPRPVAVDRSRAVSRLRSALARLAAERGFTLDEFQATTDETPYLTAYAGETKEKGWMQVPVRLLIKGRAPTLMAGLAALRNVDVPFEADSIEMTRRTTDDKGMATVSAQVNLRVLVYKGEG